ncbi:MAG: sigma-70 family RNA polymerase sigma factor [Planctomycetes bacterium]|nr:sigma-70 family RNA polymerase sigma factor [Planctomycetota bacterium]
MTASPARDDGSLDPAESDLRRLTLLLTQADGDEPSRTDLFELVYGQLRELARGQMSKERSDHTLGPTVLVHEAWLRLNGPGGASFGSRAHFFGSAGEAMRRVLVDHARKKRSAKRGGRLERLPLDALELQQTADDESVLRIDEALTNLEALDERLARVVRLRFWAGLDERQTAELLELSPRSVRRDWKLARAWLARELER